MGHSDGKSMREALSEISDLTLVRLREEHKRDPLWHAFRFGDWVQLQLSFREERGHARGFRKGVKMGLVQAEGTSAPPISVKTLTWAWGAFTPLLALANAALLPLVVQFGGGREWLKLAFVSLLFPATVYLQAVGTGFLVRRLLNKALNKPDDGDVIVVKIPVNKYDVNDEELDDGSRWGQEQISDAISNGASNRHKP